MDMEQRFNPGVSYNSAIGKDDSPQSTTHYERRRHRYAGIDPVTPSQFIGSRAGEPNEADFEEVNELQEFLTDKKDTRMEEEIKRPFKYGFYVKSREDLFLIKAFAKKFGFKEELPDTFNYTDYLLTGEKACVGLNTKTNTFIYEEAPFGKGINLYNIYECFDCWSLGRSFLDFLKNPSDIIPINKNKKYITIEGNKISLESFECAVEDNFDNFIQNITYENEVQENFKKSEEEYIKARKAEQSS